MKKILVLSGDGIGPEVMGQATRLLEELNNLYGLGFVLEEALIGGSSYEQHKTPLTDEVMQQAIDADAILLGAVGGPKWDGDAVERHLRPEAALLRLRKELDLFANLRPAITLNALVSASSLKPELVTGLDLLVVRELTSGVYFGEPRGMQENADGTMRCVDTQSYNQQEIERVAEIAFSLAKKRRGLVHSVEKANVMETGAFWRRIVTDYHQKHHQSVKLEHLYADNCAMQLVRYPKQFDVIVTDNLFGDLLSDCAAMLTGSLGMLASASLGAKDSNTGKMHAMYEPVHGSAPDIAGQNIANPLATILSVAMMLDYSFDLADFARAIEQAVEKVLADGYRSADIIDKNDKSLKLASTSEMGDLVLAALQEIDLSSAVKQAG